ncbi:mimecan isoform X1 [Podarcis raffonei]|uniref:mimecan isoform X1 n=1 Tax=Podarcis raffonei TaxID=65483 RepID=UPI00232966FD|nr:mimecan isoform X1 [Podarcis raffonei]XP_053233613.1 mimecan isoform X1 [Podarcis raffonei]
MKTLQKFGLFFYFLLPLVKLAPPKQHSATFYDPGLATLEETIFKQSYEDIIFKEDYEDKPQDAVKNQESNDMLLFHENELQMQRDEEILSEGSTNLTDLATCLLCVCLSGSVYCEETDMESVPALPKETGYLYARFNKIKKLKVSDFAEIPTLKRIDLTGNMIQDIEDGTFAKLVLLEELSLADNRLAKLPTLPPKLTSLKANNNFIKSRGIKANAFKKLTNLSFLDLGHNLLESVPLNLPESLRTLNLQFNNITSITDETFCKGNNQTRYVRQRMDIIRMDGNPVILGKYPNAFMCLRTLPIGTYF